MKFDKKSLKEWGVWVLLIVVVLYTIINFYGEQSPPMDKEQNNTKQLLILVGLGLIAYWYYNQKKKAEFEQPLYSPPSTPVNLVVNISQIKSPIKVEGGEWVFMPDKGKDEQS